MIYFHPDINECSSNPCLNGGTCVDQVNGYLCNCQDGYQGVRCQTSRYSVINSYRCLAGHDVWFLGHVHTNPFSDENGAVLLRFQKDLLPHLSFSYRFRIVFARPHYNADQERSHKVASVCHFGYSRSTGLAPDRIYFDDVTVENSVFKKHRFQIAPLWRAFSNDSVFGDRFRRCSVDDSPIRSKIAPFSFENGLV